MQLRSSQPDYWIGTEPKSAPLPAASAQPADVLRIQVERSHNGHTAQGTVLLHRSAAPDAGQSPPPSSLALAPGWHSASSV